MGQEVLPDTYQKTVSCHRKKAGGRVLPAYQIPEPLSIKLAGYNAPAYKKKGILSLPKILLIRRKKFLWTPYLIIDLTHVKLGEQLNTCRYLTLLRFK